MSGLLIPAKVLEQAVRAAVLQSIGAVDVEALSILTAKEAAAILKLTPARLRQLRADCFDMGRGNTRWSLKDIRALLEKRRVKGRS